MESSTDAPAVVVDATVRERDLTFCESARTMLTPKAALSLFVFLCFLGGMIALISLGYVEQFAVAVRDLGVVGHVIFASVIVFVVQPFGWGFSVVVIALGFTFGWVGLATTHIGLFVGSSLCFVVIKTTSRACLQAKIDDMEPKTRAICKNLMEATEKDNVTAVLVLIGLRQTPLTTGIVSGMLSLTDISYVRFITTTHIGALIDTPVLINVGILIEKAGGALAGGETAEGAGQQNAILYVQVAVAVLILVGSGYYGKKLMERYSDPENVRRDSVRYSETDLEAALATRKVEPAEEVDVEEVEVEKSANIERKVVPAEELDVDEIEVDDQIVEEATENGESAPPEIAVTDVSGSSPPSETS